MFEQIVTCSYKTSFQIFFYLSTITIKLNIPTWRNPKAQAQVGDSQGIKFFFSAGIHTAYHQDIIVVESWKVIPQLKKKCYSFYNHNFIIDNTMRAHHNITLWFNDLHGEQIWAQPVYPLHNLLTVYHVVIVHSLSYP